MGLENVDLQNVSPFYLMRKHQLTHRQIRELQNELVSIGKSLWDWPTYEHLYRDILNELERKERAALIRKEAARLKRAEREKRAEQEERDKCSRLAPLSTLVTGNTADCNDILSCIKQLTPKQREAIKLLYIEGYTVRRTAEILNVTPASVMNRKQAAIANLRRLYQQKVG